MGVEARPPPRHNMNQLGSLDPALGCSGVMSILSYDSHPVSRRRNCDELPRRDRREDNSYTKEQMDSEISRVAREMYRAFSGLNEGFENAADQVVIDELSTHTDDSRAELIHPYRTLYGRSLNLVLKDNLGDNWEEACTTLMSEMRMYELECLRRRMEDRKSQLLRLAQNDEETSEEISVSEIPRKSSLAKTNNNGSIGGKNAPEDIETCKSEEEAEDSFTGHSCLLVTWKTNPEVEKFKELYMDGRGLFSVKTHKRKSKNLVDPGELVSEKSLHKSYKILGQGEGIERLLVKNKKDNLEEVDGDCYRYYLLAGTTHPYPDDTFYSVGRVPRKLLMKYLGIKMYLVRLRKPPSVPGDWRHCDQIAWLDLALSPLDLPPPPLNRKLRKFISIQFSKCFS